MFPVLTKVSQKSHFILSGLCVNDIYFAPSTTEAEQEETFSDVEMRETSVQVTKPLNLSYERHKTIMTVESRKKHTQHYSLHS